VDAVPLQNNKQIFPWLNKPDYNLTTDMGRGDLLHEGLHARPGQAVLRLLRARRKSLAASRRPVGREVQGQVRHGLERLREQIFANQKKLGVIPECEADGWLESLPKWDTLSADQRKLFARQAEVYAAYTAYTDHRSAA
jgi:arylsulfatase